MGTLCILLGALCRTSGGSRQMRHSKTDSEAATTIRTVVMLLFCVYWVLIELFINLICLIIYKIYKRSMAVCTACGAAQSSDHLYRSI